MSRAHEGAGDASRNPGGAPGGGGAPLGASGAGGRGAPGGGAPLDGRGGRPRSGAAEPNLDFGDLVVAEIGAVLTALRDNLWKDGYGRAGDVVDDLVAIVDDYMWRLR